MPTPVQLTGATGVAANAATLSQGTNADSALQSFTETDPVAGAALTTHSALSTTAHGGVVASTDSRLTNARTPTSHASSHLSGGSDAISGLLSADTGWTANSGAGDKTVAVPNYTTGITGTMSTALNVTSAGLGTALATIDSTLVSLVKKVQALETALAANKTPNA